MTSTTVEHAAGMARDAAPAGDSIAASRTRRTAAESAEREPDLVYFEPNSAEVSETGRIKVLRWAQQYRVNGRGLVILRGYAHTIGTGPRAARVAERRLSEVADVLRENGVAMERIATINLALSGTPRVTKPGQAFRNRCVAVQFADHCSTLLPRKVPLAAGRAGRRRKSA